MKKYAFLIGIAGGTGSGKTTITNEISAQLKSEVAVIEQDSYYKDLSNLNLEERNKINYDHPDSIDFDLMKDHLQKLVLGENIMIVTIDENEVRYMLNLKVIDPRKDNHNDHHMH